MLPIQASDMPFAHRRAPVDPATTEQVRPLIDAVRDGGELALHVLCERFGDLGPGGALILDREALAEATDALPTAERQVLERTVARVRSFAEATRAAIQDVELAIPGGRAGLRWAPVARAACYAPGGRHPLPSSVIMTAVTAVAAGVPDVWVASPRPAPATLAAAYLSGASHLLCAGGAHAVAALVWGAGRVPACDALVGPGNRYVTAAKQLVSGVVAIDMLAGPSELLVLADETADAATVAADLLAQAEHDPDACPMLISTSQATIDAVQAALTEQLASLPTAAVAREALANGFARLAADRAAMAKLADAIAPEHLALHVRQPSALAAMIQHYGAVFLGEGAAEVLGDYGAGPNHVLPTGGTARSFGGLSVAAFLRPQQWLAIEDAQAGRALATDAAALARIEGLEAHARAADRRG